MLQRAPTSIWVGAEDEEPRPFLVRLRFTAEDPALAIENVRAVLTYVASQLGD